MSSLRQLGNSRQVLRQKVEYQLQKGVKTVFTHVSVMVGHVAFLRRIMAIHFEQIPDAGWFPSNMSIGNGF